MASSKDVVVLLHHTLPAAIVLYYLLASLISAIAASKSDAKISRKLKALVILLSGLMIISYGVESAITIAQIISQRSGQFGGKHSNLFTLAESLVWVLLTVSIVDLECPPSYPHIGAWALNLAAESTITALSLSSATGHYNFVEGLQISLQLARLLLSASLIALCISHACCSCRKDRQVISDEETTPLLANHDDGNEPDTPTKHIGTIEITDETALSEAADRDLAKDKKELKDKLDKLEDRVKQEGNWIKYFFSYSIFVPYIWPSKKPKLFLNMAGTLICMLGERGVNVLIPLQYGLIINLLTERDGRVFGAMGMYILYELLNSYYGLMGLRNMLWLPVIQYTRTSFKVASHAKIMDMSCDFHDEKRSGELSEVTSQGMKLVSLLDKFLLELIPVVIDLCLALGYFYILFDSYILLMGAATMGFYLLASSHITSFQMKYSRKTVVASRKSYNVMLETMNEWRTVSYFNRVPFAKEAYRYSAHLTQKLRTKNSMIWFIGFAMTDMILNIGCYSAYLFCAYQVIFEGVDVGTFVILVSFWDRLQSPITQMAHMHQDILEDLVAAEELLRLFRREPSIKDGPKELDISESRIVFDKVSFGYTDKPETLQDVSFVAEGGKTLALVGETGAGKSTITKLLLRFYDVTKGSISIDDQDVRELTLHSLREHIGVVPQDPSLFNDTVITNIRYAKLDATDAEIHEACKAAAIHDKIMSFKEGYQTLTGENGVKLSGGELQRIAIARAILKDPKIIVLDEATSAVDNETELKIQTGLKRLCKGRTTIVVAHRLSTIIDADCVLVLKDGHIEERGAPSDLLKNKDGKFYKLWHGLSALKEEVAKAETSDTLVDTSTNDSSSGDAKPEVEPRSRAVSASKANTPGPASKTPSHGRKGKGKKRFRPEAPEFVPGSPIAQGSDSQSTLATPRDSTPNEFEGDMQPPSKHQKRLADVTSIDTQKSSSGAGPSKLTSRNYGSIPTLQPSPSVAIQPQSSGPPSNDSSTHTQASTPTAPPNTPLAGPQSGLGNARAGNQRRLRQRHRRNMSREAANSESSRPSIDWADNVSAGPAQQPTQRSAQPPVQRSQTGQSQSGSTKSSGPTVRFVTRN